MDVLKKIAGFILLLFAGIIGLATLFSIFNTINRCIKKIQSSTAEGLGYVIGSIVGFILVAVVIYFISKLALKLINDKNKDNVIT